MPRVQVIADDGWVALDEPATSSRLGSDHYRRHLADRIAWAVEDAEAHAARPAVVDLATARSPAHRAPAAVAMAVA